MKEKLYKGQDSANYRGSGEAMRDENFVRHGIFGNAG